jgi:DNA primase
MGKMINFAHVNAEADFTAMLNHFGFEFTQKGAQIRMCCPFHEDATPSMSVTLEETDKAMANTFHCFGCGTKGSVIDFAAKHTGDDLRSSAELVANVSNCTLAPAKTGSKTPKTGRTKPAQQKRADTTSKGSKEASATTNGDNKPLPFTLDLELDHEDVLRRLDEEAAKHFGVGRLADGSKGMMAGRICIPIHNVGGELVAYAGRWPSDDVPDGEDKYLFPPRFNKMQELYNLHRLENARHIVIVEGFFSAMQLHQLGVPVVALMGTAISDEQVALLVRAGVKSALVLLDGDEPGCKASETVGVTLMQHMFARVMHLPDGYSPDDADMSVLQAALPFPLRNQF